MLKAVLFDLDETLIDAHDAHLAATQATFEANGLDYDQARRNTAGIDFMGLRQREILRTLRDSLAVGQDEVSLAKLLHERDERFVATLSTAYVLPGAQDALRAVHDLGLITAVVSSSTNRAIRHVLSHFRLDGLVNFVVSGDDVTHGKPDPECYQLALRRLQSGQVVGHGDCLVVEDAPNGVQAAQGAGLPVCYVPSRPNLPVEGVHCQLDSLCEFPSLVLRVTRA